MAIVNLEVVSLEVEDIGLDVVGSEHASLEAVSSEVVGPYCTLSSYLAFVLLLLHLCRRRW